MIRQYTWRDYYRQHTDRVATPVDLRDTEVGLRMHVDHCIESLRISLMCHADVTPFLIAEAPERFVKLKADFSPHRRCRKLEPLVKYMEENQMLT